MPACIRLIFKPVERTVPFRIKHLPTSTPVPSRLQHGAISIPVLKPVDTQALGVIYLVHQVRMCKAV